MSTVETVAPDQRAVDQLGLTQHAADRSAGYCTSCGHATDPGDPFCGSCGAAMSAAGGDGSATAAGSTSLSPALASRFTPKKIIVALVITALLSIGASVGITASVLHGTLQGKTGARGATGPQGQPGGRGATGR